MFDISLSEVILVLIAGFLFLGPRELARMIRTAKSYLTDIKTQFSEIEHEISEQLESDDFVKIIHDPKGKKQKVYDLEKIKPHLKKDDEE